MGKNAVMYYEGRRSCTDRSRSNPNVFVRILENTATVTLCFVSPTGRCLSNNIIKVAIRPRRQICTSYNFSFALRSTKSLSMRGYWRVHIPRHVRVIQLHGFGIEHDVVDATYPGPAAMRGSSSFAEERCLVHTCKQAHQFKDQPHALAERSDRQPCSLI